MDYMTYEEYRKSKAKYFEVVKCGVMDCNSPGLYEGGDARCWFPMCEEHVKLKDKYAYDMRYKKKAHEKWLKHKEKYNKLNNK